MNSKKVLFELHGFQVLEDSIYLVADKMDYSAPTAFQEIGSTVLPSDGVATTYHCPYIAYSRTEGVWDTGFYELSPCYKNMSKDIVAKEVKALIQNVLTPYRKAIGNEKALDQHNHEHLDKAKWSVYKDKVFKTDDPMDVMALYFALRGREVVPKAKAGDSSFNAASYMIIDINQKIKKRDEDASNIFEAIGMFEVLYKTDKGLLDKILYYLGRAMSEDTTKTAYRGMFKAYLEASPANVNSFNKLVESSEKESEVAKLNIYHAIKSHEIKTPKLTKSPGGMILYDDIELGPDLKTAADRIAKHSDFADIKREILFGE